MTFSIIIPVYNVAPYLRECLDSVLAQTYTDWEAIGVDDGSTDGSGVILDEYAQRDDRIKVMHRSNSGVGNARNAALSVAGGEWILFLDADDGLRRDALEWLAKVAVDYPAEDLIHFGYEKGVDSHAFNVAHGCGKVVCCDISRRVDHVIYTSYAWQFAFKHKLVSGIAFPQYIRGEDRVFLLQVLCNRAESCLMMDDKLYFYRKRQGSAMNRRPSVQTLKDELSHRLDVIGLIDGCGKKMPYAGGYWLEDYCLRQYIRIVELEGDYTCEEQRELIDWFYHELPRICNARDYSLKGKFYARLYYIFRGRFGRHLVSSLLPRVFHKIYVLVNPFALMRSIRWRLNGKI